jgi:hypothetical protein
LKNRIEQQPQVYERTEFITTFEEVTTSAKPLMQELKKLPKTVKSILEKIPHQEVMDFAFMSSINPHPRITLIYALASRSQ